MTEQAQRIAIAKWMGLADETRHPSPSGSCDFVLNPLPDYTRDLNAMAQAEAKLDVNRLALYADELDKLCVPQHICALTHWQAVAMATAAQRAEALLRTLNLWVDDTPSPA